MASPTAGGLATLLAARSPQRYAGLATVAAAVRTDPAHLRTGGPIDYLNIHGLGDQTVPYAGEKRGETDVIYSAPEVVAAMSARNGHGGRTKHIPVEGMAHEWPSRDRGLRPSARGVDVNAEIRTFFGLADTQEP